MSEDDPSLVLSGETLAQVTDAVIAIMASAYGRGAPQGKSHLLDDMLVTVLRDGLLPVERTLTRKGREEDVRRLRLVFEEEMREEFTAAVARITGYRVVDYHSQILLRAELVVEMFALAP
jgi:uncharacterized protein YbcI